tara:strand:+ start:134 stop:1462 length:1329 start_codon:yes stop_codon:yes gene_type:complete
MLFDFLKYIQPTHYFGLLNKKGKSVFPIYDFIPVKVLDQLKSDPFYLSNDSIQYDLSWQAIQKGYIVTSETLAFNKKIPLIDEYRFVRKYFNSFWVYYILILRLLSFCNPLKELYAIFKTRKVKKENVYQQSITYPNWEIFNSNLIKEQPKVSVIIPTLNRYEYLKDVLLDLEQQDYTNFEVIVVDQSEPFHKEFYSNFKLNIKLIHQKEKALWLARNTAIKTSKSDYLLLFDDDSRVEKDWISNHLKCLDFFKAAISSGTSISVVGAKVPDSYAYFKISDQLDTGNVLIKRSVFKKIGLFDRQFEKQRMGDGEFGLRAHLAGYLNVSNPKAKRLHLKVETGGLRQMGSWDAMRPTNWFAPRPIPSVVYLFISYFGRKLTFFALLKSVPPSLVPYKFKGNKKMMILSYLFSIILFPILLFQVHKSWKLANIKLKEGSKIERL